MTDEAFDVQLGYFARLLLCGPGVFLWRYDSELRLLSSSCPDSETVASFLLLGGCQEYLADYLRAGKRAPLVLTSPLGMSWIAAAAAEEEQVRAVCLIGPTFSSDVSPHELEQELYSRGFPREMVQAFLAQLSRLPIIPWVSWLQLGKMLQYTVNGIETDISEFSYQTGLDSRAARGQSPAYASKGSTWLAEQEAMRMIEEGRLDYRQSFERIHRYSAYVKTEGEHGSELRKTRGAVISFITLSTRAAIRGGLDPETAYFVGEQYVQSAETAASVAELSQLNNLMFDDFVRRVHRVRASSGLSAPIRSCCDFIELHLSEPFSLTRLAKELGYSEYYLSRKFKAEMGQTPARYLRACRIRRAQQLLRATNRSVQDIAADVGFSSSSRFISLFREETGVTPGEYRDGR